MLLFLPYTHVYVDTELETDKDAPAPFLHLNEFSISVFHNSLTYHRIVMCAYPKHLSITSFDHVRRSVHLAHYCHPIIRKRFRVLHFSLYHQTHAVQPIKKLAVTRLRAAILNVGDVVEQYVEIICRLHRDLGA